MAPTYENLELKLDESLNTERNLAPSSSPEKVLTSTRLRRKVKVESPIYHNRNLRTRRCLNKDDQDTYQEGSIYKQFFEDSDDDMKPRKIKRARRRVRRRKPFSRGSVGAVHNPPTPADAMEFKKWPAADMVTRPEWPRAGASRSPTPPPPPPPDSFEAAADAVRRSMHKSLHNALAFGAQACRDIKEEMVAENNKKPSNHEETTELDHYLLTCYQDTKNIYKQVCGANNSEVNLTERENGSDNNSDRVDFSDGIVKSNSNDSPTTSKEIECSESNYQSQIGTMEAKFGEADIIVEEKDKFLQFFGVNKIEDSFSVIACEREVPTEDKQENNYQDMWNSLLISNRTSLLNSTSEHDDNICADSSTQLDTTGSRQNEPSLEQTSDNNSTFRRKEDAAIEALLPVIFHRALHYCITSDVSPQDLASYIDTLTPESIMNWPE